MERAFLPPPTLRLEAGESCPFLVENIVVEVLGIIRDFFRARKSIQISFQIFSERHRKIDLLIRSQKNLSSIDLAPDISRIVSSKSKIKKSFLSVHDRILHGPMKMIGRVLCLCPYDTDPDIWILFHPGEYFIEGIRRLDKVIRINECDEVFRGFLNPEGMGSCQALMRAVIKIR